MKRAIAIDYLPYNCWVADDVYMYGTTSSPAQTLERIAHGSRTQESCHDFGSGNQITNGMLYLTDQPGELFACVKVTASSQYYLARSTDYGATFSTVYTFTDVNTYMRERALAVGYPGGVRTYAIGEYSTSGSRLLRILTSADGENWTVACSVTGGTTGTNIYHWHVIAWNPYTEKWCVGTGDQNAQNCVFTTDDLTLIPNDTAANIVATAGITGASGTQHHRTVDFLFTPEYTYTATDTITGGLADRGVWRWNHALTRGQQVDIGDGRYDSADSRTTMWTGVHAEGHLLFCSYEQTDVAGKRHIEIYAAEDTKADAGNWREIARVYTRQGTTSDARGFWYANGTFGICFGKGAGKQTQNETALFRLDDVYTDDFLATSPGTAAVPLTIPDTIHPVYWVDVDSGSDGNDGYSPASAWATIDKALKGGTGTGAVTITSSTAAASYLTTVTTAGAHTYSAGSRVTIAGHSDAGLNGSWVVYDSADSTHFRIKVPATIAGGTGGTVNDTYSNITYGGKVIVKGSARVTTSFNVQVDKFPYNSLVSNVLGFSGESGHPIQLAQYDSSAVIVGDSGTSGVAPFTLNTSGDWFILDGLSIYNERAAAGSRSLYAAAAGSQFWARDAQIGHADYSAIGWRNGSSNDGTQYLLRCHIVGDTALGGVNQPGVEIDGTTHVHMHGCLVETTYRGVRKRTAGTGLTMAGCSVRNFSQMGIDTTADATGSWSVRGCAVVSSNGTSAGVDSSTGALAAGFATENNFFERTPTRARDQGATNIIAQVTGQPLTYYFDGGDPRNGPAAGSPIIDTGAFGGSHDYALTRRKNPSSRGHLEYGAGTRRPASRRAK